ncbi:MAG: host attachment protein [Parachlamydiaceae bacterium]
MKKENWLVIANSSLARIFKIENGHHLKQIKILEHPESRLHNLDLVSDKPGRVNESANVSRHALEKKTTPKDHEFSVFAKAIADFLNHAHNQGEFDGLYLAASPSCLGLLRETIDPNLAKTIKREIDKDMTHMTSEDIQSHFPFQS